MTIAAQAALERIDNEPASYNERRWMMDTSFIHINEEKRREKLNMQKWKVNDARKERKKKLHDTKTKKRM